MARSCSICFLAILLGWSAATALAGSNPEVLEEIDVFTDGDFLLLPLTLAGKQALFVLDTGSDCCVYDIALLPGTPQETVKGNTPDGSVDLKLFRAPQIMLGRTPLVGRPLVAGVDLASLRETQGHDIRGIIGMDVLRQHVIRVDFDRGKLTFQRSGDGPGELTGPATGLETRPTPGSTTGTPVPLVFQPSSPLPHVLVRLAGLERPLLFRIDTGMLASGVIRKETADELVRNRRATWWCQTHATTLAGGSLRSVWRVEEGQLHDWKHVLFLREGNVNSMGLDYLRRFNITFDFPRGTAYFSKSQNFNHQTRMNKTGIRLSQKAGRTWVHTVAEKSPGALAGLRAGDEVVSIDGNGTQQARLKSLDDLLTASGKTISLRLVRNNEQVQITLPALLPPTP